MPIEDVRLPIVDLICTGKCREALENIALKIRQHNFGAKKKKSLKENIAWQVAL